MLPRRGSSSPAQRLGLLLILLLVLLSVPGRARADGMYAPSTGEAVADTADQQALLLFGTDTTHLVLRTGYRGNGQPFTWIVPCWGELRREDISTVEAVLLEAFDDFTSPQRLEYELACGSALGCAGEDSADEASTTREKVTVLDTFRVDDYEIGVLRADSGKVLVDWLVENGYRVPEGGEAVFSEYISSNFDHFVTVRFASVEPLPASSGAGYGGDPGGPSSAGTAPALVLRFPTLMSTFPLKISALSTKQVTEVVLFAVGRGRYRVEPSRFATLEMTLPETYQGEDFTGYYRTRFQSLLASSEQPAFAVEYAGPLPPVLQEQLSHFRLLPEGAGQELFVTRLHTRLEPAQLDRDVPLELEVGERSRRYHRIRVVTGQPTESGLALVLPLDLLAIFGLARLAVRRRRVPRTAGAVQESRP